MSLEGLRGLAALTVVLAHAFYVYFPYLTSRREPYTGAVAKTVLDETLHRMPFNLLFIADAAVILFFVLSGYVLMIKFFRKQDVVEIQSAAVRRYIRLMLPAGVSIFFAWAILSLGWMGNHLVGVLDVSGWPISYYPEKKTLWDAVASAVWYTPFRGDSYFNGPLWSIQVEFLGSMLLFASFALFGRSSLVLTALFFIFVAKMMTGNSATILYYLAILSGSLLHGVTEKLKSRPWVSLALAIAGLVVLTVDNSGQYEWLLRYPVPNLDPFIADFNTNKLLFWQTIGATAIVAGTIGSPSFARMVGSKIPEYLGKISYAMYLLHMPLIMSLMLWTMLYFKNAGFGFLLQVSLSFLVFFAVLIVLADLFTRFVDRSAIRWARSFDNWLHWKRGAPQAINTAPVPDRTAPPL